MKGTGINLLISREDYRKIENLFAKLRIITLILSIALFVYLAGFFIAYRKLTANISNLEAQKRDLLTEITKLASAETSLIYISGKTSLIDQYLKEDTQILSYYNYMRNILSTSPVPITLTGFSYDKSRHVEFTISLDSSSDFLDVFKFIESKEFLKHFVALTMSGFDVNEKTKNTLNLSFQGEINLINEKL